MNENQTQTAMVDFHGHTLITVRHNGTDYIAMKSVVEGMGLAWQVQQRKIISSERYHHMMLPLQTSGGLQEMLCIPLKKLNEWLFSINPEKVRSEIRATVVMYQEECFLSVSGHRNKDAGIHPEHKNIHENQIQAATVDFHGHTLITVLCNGIEYVAMKPVVMGIGLDWRSQQRKIAEQKEKFNCGHMPIVADDGKKRSMICMPLANLNGWLLSINPEKVRPEIRATVMMYQKECFVVLYDYWHKGTAVNPRFQPQHQPRQVTIAEILSEAEAGMDLARILGLTTDHARRFMNEMVKKACGTDCLDIAEQTRGASERHDIYLTTTQLGKRLGLTPHKTNKLLERRGLIESFRNDKGQLRWKPAARGKPYVIGKGAKRNPGNYDRVHQLLFLESVIEVIVSSTRLG